MRFLACYCYPSALGIDNCGKENRVVLALTFINAQCCHLTLNHARALVGFEMAPIEYSRRRTMQWGFTTVTISNYFKYFYCKRIKTVEATNKHAVITKKIQ